MISRPTPSAEVMNEALRDLYENKLVELTPGIARYINLCGWNEDQVSKLFFMKVDEAYAKAPTKILFVGRETFGWGERGYDWRDDAKDLMNIYERFSNEGKQYNSPFWWFKESFSKKMNIGENYVEATLWTNLSKIDVGKKRLTGKQFDSLMQIFISLLVAEIEIVKPDIILIMTRDSSYNKHLNNYGWFHNEPYKPYIEINLPWMINNVSLNDAVQSFETIHDESWINNYKLLTGLGREPIVNGKIDRLTGFGRLPTHTYQICHPNVLRRCGNYTERADELIQALVQQINSSYLR